MDTHKKETQALGMPWEAQYGYAQGLKQDGTVWLSGQIGHDEQGTVSGDMETQMRQAYANIRTLLAGFGITMADVVDEVLYVLDNDTAFAARQKLGREVYPDPMQVPSTMIGVAKLNTPDFLVEIKVIAKKPDSAAKQLEKRVINPWEWQNERGYVQAVEVKQPEATLYMSGQTAIDADGQPSTGDMRTQLLQVLGNVEQVIGTAGYHCRDIVRFTIYTTATAELIENFDLITAWVTQHGIQAAGTMVDVNRLAYESLKVEIEVTAVR